MKKLINQLLPQFLINKFKILIGWNWFSMSPALKRAAERGIQIETIIDIGASDGRWSKDCFNYFKEANYLLIEAQDIHRIKIEKFASRNKSVQFYIGAAGDIEGQVYFDTTEAEGGLASHSEIEDCEKQVLVEMNTLDNLVRIYNLNPPFLIKLDTHGFEVPILEGSREVLKNTNLIIIEAYNYKLTNNTLLFYELCNYMESFGFRPIDIADVSYRKYDNTFWQMDIFFVPINSPEFSYNKYK